jgi:AcrR family transcriptional regulator
MAPIVVDKAKKKTDILNAAIEVFATKGVANAKMNDIAIAANIGKGTIYEYFSSKEDIFSTAFHVFLNA